LALEIYKPHLAIAATMCQNVYYSTVIYIKKQLTFQQISKRSHNTETVKCHWL